MHPLNSILNGWYYRMLGQGRPDAVSHNLPTLFFILVFKFNLPFQNFSMGGAILLSLTKVTVLIGSFTIKPQVWAGFLRKRLYTFGNKKQSNTTCVGRVSFHHVHFTKLWLRNLEFIDSKKCESSFSWVHHCGVVPESLAWLLYSGNS